MIYKTSLGCYFLISLTRFGPLCFSKLCTSTPIHTIDSDLENPELPLKMWMLPVHPWSICVTRYISVLRRSLTVAGSPFCFKSVGLFLFFFCLFFLWDQNWKCNFETCKMHLGTCFWWQSFVFVKRDENISTSIKPASDLPQKTAVKFECNERVSRFNFSFWFIWLRQSFLDSQHHEKSVFKSLVWILLFPFPSCFLDLRCMCFLFWDAGLFFLLMDFF